MLRYFDPQELITPGIITRFGCIPTWGAYQIVKHHARDFDVNYSINDMGFRDRRHPIGSVPGVKRIAVMGSSYVFGMGVEDDQVFTSLIEDGLNNSEVLNFGVVGSGLSVHSYLYRTVARQYNPDVVLLHIHFNGRDDMLHADLTPVVGKPDPMTERTRLLLRAIPGYYWLGERSHLLARERKSGHGVAIDPVPVDQTRKELAYADVIIAFADMVRSDGRKFIILYEDAVVRGLPVVAEVVRRYGVGVVLDAGDRFAGDSHWSSSGHLKVAGKIIEVL